MGNNIPTAEDFLREKIVHFKSNGRNTIGAPDRPDWQTISEWINEYAILKAKFYVQEALKAASTNGKVALEPMGVNLDNGESVYDPHYIVDKDSILNTYSLENIK